MIRVLWDRLRKSIFDFEDENVHREKEIFLYYLRIFFLLGYGFAILTLFWVTFLPKQVVLDEINRKKSVQPLKIKRGSIYDKAGRVLAHTVYLPALHCSPRDIARREDEDPERFKEWKKEFAGKIAKAFNLDAHQVLEKLNAKDPDKGYLKNSVILSPVLDMDPDELERKVYDFNVYWEGKLKDNKKQNQIDNSSSRWHINKWINNLLRNIKVSIEKVYKILWEKEGKSNKKEAEGPPLFVRYEWVRKYPHKEIAGNIIGFASFNDKGGISRFEGKDGLELELEKYLSPNPVDPAKTKQDNGKVNLVTDIPKGNDVCLTIDMEIQTCLEKELDKRIEECYAEDGMGVVLDPHTGAILAIASRPSYDPNLLIASRQDAFKNKVISECFEPGSTFKIVTASAGLEQGKVDLYTSIDCEGGRLKVGKKVIRDVHAMYVSSFWECFEQSSNVAFVKVGMLVGLDSLKDYIRKFGFGQKASDDFQNERMGAISTNTALTTLSSMSIGYAVAVTTLQLARAYAVIANGGYLVDAYIVDKVVSELEEASGDGLDSAINELNQGSNDESEKLDGILKDKSDNQPKEFKVVYRHEVKRERVISEETAEKMKMLCHQVILKGTGKSALIPEYKAGGKTGTAHLAKPADLGGGYDPNRIISLFAGFAPLKNPRIVVVIVIRYPQSKIRFGGYVCGPVFKNVVYHTLTYLNVPPEPLDMKEVKRDGFLAQESYNDDNDTINLAELEPIIPGEISDKKTANAGESENRPLERTQLTDKDGLSGNRFGDKNSELEILGLFNPKDIEYIVARSKLERSMPNLIGLTKLQAMEILEGLGLGYECNGYGRVVEQYPLPGDSIEGVDVCVIELSNDISNLSMNN